MVHWANLIVDDEFTIVGRGLTIVVDLKKNGFTTQTWVKDTFLKTGDTVNFRGETFMITGIETHKNLLNGFNSIKLGLLLKKIENEEVVQK